MEEGTDLKSLSEGKISLTPMNVSFSAQPSQKIVEHAFKQEW
jgi:broad specificity polyphosphatase/5'/3'-nucleotidase SurE